MKAKVNPGTGMVALVAGDSIMNVKKGGVFGVLPKDAANILGQKHATLCKDLPEGSDKWPEVDLNVEQGVAGEVEEPKPETPAKSEAEPQKKDEKPEPAKPAPAQAKS